MGKCSLGLPSLNKDFIIIIIIIIMKFHSLGSILLGLVSYIIKHTESLLTNVD